MLMPATASSLHSHPTSLDALLFALFHTILSLDATSNNVVQRLRAAINGEGSGDSSLAAWTKWVYTGWVKEREVEWQREQQGKQGAGAA